MKNLILMFMTFGLARSRGNNNNTLINSCHTCVDFSEYTVEPSQYTAFSSKAINGSSRDGHCLRYSNTETAIHCFTPSTSVLFDGHIPTLTGLEGNTWASQLLTLQADGHRSEDDHLYDVNITVPNTQWRG